MSQEEIPAEPNDNAQFWELIKRSLPGSVLDQITAVREEALDTGNAALKLAADAELRAASTEKDLGLRLDHLERLLEQIVSTQ